MFEDLRVCRQEIFGREVDARKFRAVMLSGLLRMCKAAPFLCDATLLRWTRVDAGYTPNLGVEVSEVKLYGRTWFLFTQFFGQSPQLF
jgi:hypothetical protein